MDRRIMIIGARKYPRLDLVRRLVEEFLPTQSVIVTGNRQGVETTVIERSCWDSEIRHRISVIDANWAGHGSHAGQIQMAQMMERSNILIAFDQNEKLKEVIHQANERKMLIYVYDEKGVLTRNDPFLWEPDESLFLPDMSGPEYAPSPENIVLNTYH